MAAIEFRCQVKQISTKKLVSGDSTTRIILEQDNLNPETISAINNLVASERNASRELEVMIQ